LVRAFLSARQRRQRLPLQPVYALATAHEQWLANREPASRHSESPTPTSSPCRGTAAWDASAQQHANVHVLVAVLRAEACATPVSYIRRQTATCARPTVFYFLQIPIIALDRTEVVRDWWCRSCSLCSTLRDCPLDAEPPRKVVR